MSTSEAKIRIRVGYNRPQLDDLNRQFVGSYVTYCTCGGQIYTREGTAKHWSMGCFDTPIYAEYTREEILAELVKQEKIKEISPRD